MATRKKPETANVEETIDETPVAEATPKPQPTEAELAMAEQLRILQEQLEERDAEVLQLAQEKEAAEAEAKAGMKNVVLAFSNQPDRGTAVVYVDGKKGPTFDEKAKLAPSTAFLRDQARRHLNRVDEGNTVLEINLDWPMPETLNLDDVPVELVRPTGKANDEYDQKAKRTDAEVDGIE